MVDDRDDSSFYSYSVRLTITVFASRMEAVVDCSAKLRPKTRSFKFQNVDMLWILSFVSVLLCTLGLASDVVCMAEMSLCKSCSLLVSFSPKRKSGRETAHTACARGGEQEKS